MRHPAEDLKNRIKDEPYGNHLRGVVDRVYAAADNAASKVEAIRADKYLSAEGKVAKIRKLMAEDVLHNFGEVSRDYSMALAQVVGRRTHMGKPDLPTDALSIAERTEVRTALRTCPEDKRLALAFELVGDRSAAEALLSGPSLALTGLSKVQMQALRKQYLETHFADEWSAVKTYEDNLQPVGAAVGLAINEFARISGLERHEFNGLLPKELCNVSNLEAALNEANRVAESVDGQTRIAQRPTIVPHPEEHAA